MYDDELWIGKEQPPVVAHFEPTNTVFWAVFNKHMEEYTFFDARCDLMAVMSAAFVSFASSERIPYAIDVDEFCRYVKNRMIRELVQKDAHMDVFQFMDLLVRMNTTGKLNHVFRICMREFKKDSS